MTIQPSDLIGAWRLQEFAVADADGVTKPWGRAIRGLLIYETSGAVSVSIQRATPDPPPADWEPVDNLLFYAGTYRFQAPSSVEHHVEIASDPARVGQILVRQATLTGDMLTLTARDEAKPKSFARIVWTRRT